VNPRIGWGQPPPGWGQPFPGWAPLVDPGSRPLQVARSVGRWLWPTTAISGFLAVVASTFAHDDPAPGLSHRGLFTIALAALVVVLLTVHRRYGPRSLARAIAEYTVVALLAGLLAADAGVDQPPANHATPATADQAKTKPAATPKTEAAAGDDRPAVIQAAAKVFRAITGAVGWLVDLWRQADRTTAPTKGAARAASPPSPAPSALSLWRSP
jgi:energy-coupling factor transporter transmembrane protein EcfT